VRHRRREDEGAVETPSCDDVLDPCREGLTPVIAEREGLTREQLACGSDRRSHWSERHEQRLAATVADGRLMAMVGRVIDEAGEVNMETLGEVTEDVPTPDLVPFVGGEGDPMAKEQQLAHRA
jgi:hypothetical protein